MNIRKLKELEDLRFEESTLRERLQRLKKNNIDTLIESANKDFKDFFESEGFTITGNCATYRDDLKIHLNEVHPKNDSLTLNISVKSAVVDKNYSVFIVEFPSKKKQTSTLFSSLDENRLKMYNMINDPVLREISNTQEEIEKLKKKLEELPDAQYLFQIEQNQNKQQFKTFSEVLQYLFLTNR